MRCGGTTALLLLALGAALAPVDAFARQFQSANFRLTIGDVPPAASSGNFAGTLRAQRSSTAKGITRSEPQWRYINIRRY